MKIIEAILYTNRNIMVIDGGGGQVPELQAKITCYECDKATVKHLAGISEKFFIAKWMGWKHEISKTEFMFLLGMGKESEVGND